MSETTRIHDRGYRRYEGERTGSQGAIRTTARHTFARILGLRRNGKAKALPFIVAGIAYLPAIVFVGIGVLVPKKTGGFLSIQYWEYYRFIILAIVLFIAFAAPEALCPDRRHRVMGVYLSSPLTRNTYLLAKFIAVTSALSIVTLFPPLLMALGKTLQGNGPSPRDLVVLVIRIVVSGLLLATFFALLAMAASSLTDRKGFASAGIVLAFVISGAAAGAIRDSSHSDSAVFLNLFDVPFELVRRVYNNNSEGYSFGNITIALVFFLWAALFAAVVAWRYRKLEVTR